MANTAAASLKPAPRQHVPERLQARQLQMPIFTRAQDVIAPKVTQVRAVSAASPLAKAAKVTKTPVSGASVSCESTVVSPTKPSQLKAGRATNMATAPAYLKKLKASTSANPIKSVAGIPSNTIKPKATTPPNATKSKANTPTNALKSKAKTTDNSKAVSNKRKATEGTPVVKKAKKSAITELLAAPVIKQQFKYSPAPSHGVSISLPWE
jgi:hypothetical protein